MVWYSHVLDFPQFVMIRTVKGFSMVNKEVVDVILEFSFFLYDSKDAGSLSTGSFVFSIPNLNIWKFSVQVLLKPSLENFEHYLASV